ncbi:TRAP transporter substrate-binding protein (plasmid) [Natronosalvus rutilus]|uniref:TRAP transporter substrate-binding protein n=2 Tax=Natronosalvus rutilus TaxID=2953753 RepID=A0A9E7SWS6_9EURY|nr:TRAP transporter substrate-binding protein [Natronosalvus rutilus]
MVGERLSEKTDGEIEIDAFTDNELGGLNESMENVASGALDIYVNVYGLAAGFYPEAQIFDAPYMYDDDDPYEHMIEVTDPTQSESAEELIEAIAEETGLRSLGTFPQGTRRVSISGDAVYHPDDMEDILLRGVPVPIFEETVVGLGAQVTELDWGEVPQALSTGSVDGQENPYEIMVGAGIQEHTDYVLETNHMHPALAFWINDDLWQEFSDEQQDLFYEAIHEAQPEAVEQLETNIDESRDAFLDEGAEIITKDELEYDAFVSQTREHISNEFPDFVERIEEISGETYE